MFAGKKGSRWDLVVKLFCIWTLVEVTESTALSTALNTHMRYHRYTHKCQTGEI